MFRNTETFTFHKTLKHENDLKSVQSCKKNKRPSMFLPSSVVELARQWCTNHC